MYYSRYNVFTYNLMFYICIGRQEWVDAAECVRMMTSQLGRCCQLGLGFTAGLIGAQFSIKCVYFLAVVSIYMKDRLQKKKKRKSRAARLCSIAFMGFPSGIRAFQTIAVSSILRLPYRFTHHLMDGLAVLSIHLRFC